MDEFKHTEAPRKLVDTVTRLRVSPTAVLEQDALWRPAAWVTPKLAEHEGVIAELAASSDPGRTPDERRIRRRHVASLGEPIALFFGSMIWGHGLSGYGPDRVGTIVEVAGSGLQHGLEGLIAAGKAGPSAAWDALSGTYRLKWLGPAFATKVAYFASLATEPSGQRPLIADANTSWAMWSLVGLARSVELRASYLTYVEVCHRWADQHGWRPDDVEWALFEIGKEVRKADLSGDLMSLVRLLLDSGIEYRASSRYGGSDESAGVRAVDPSGTTTLTPAEEDLLLGCR